MQLFHATNDTDSATARREVLARGLKERIDFRNVHFQEADEDFRAHGGRRLPALWDGAALHEGLDAVLARLGQL